MIVFVIYSRYILKFVWLYDLYFLGKSKYPADIEFLKVFTFVFCHFTVVPWVNFSSIFEILVKPLVIDIPNFMFLFT